jgi:adenosine deaminase
MRKVRALIVSWFCSTFLLCGFLCYSPGVSAASQSFRDVPARPITAAAQAVQPIRTSESAEQRTERALEASRVNDGALYAFLLQMPKGGDLHNHITGAAYAESFIRWAAADGLCVEPASHTLVAPPCKEGQVEAKSALTNPHLYAELIDAWSMRHFNGPNSGHDHFFDTFPKFNAVTNAHMGDMIAELARRNFDANLQYLELMTMPDRSVSIGFGSKFTFDPNFSAMRQKMLSGGLPQLVSEARHNLDAWDAQKNASLHCGDSNPNNVDPACSVAIRHDYAVLRAFAPEQVFAQLLLAFELASADPRVVGVNMVQPEDWLVPMRDYTLHMKMVSYLREVYPSVHVSLHAGEIVPGLVPPDGLRFHIREAVELARAERIGHGVDAMFEEDSQHLLATMARRNVMVEICLTSNDLILGVKGKDHPLRMYLKAGVPVALATDDEGVSRSEITREYMKAVEDQGLEYPMLKTMARTSLEHSFLSGASLWSDGRRFTAVKECSGDRPGEHNPSASCKAYLKNNERAREQWKLEKAFTEFEAKF